MHHESGNRRKVKYKLMAVINKKWTFVGHIKCGSDDRWTERVTVWLPRDCREKAGQGSGPAGGKMKDDKIEQFREKC